jgi:hypothetical protein
MDQNYKLLLYQNYNILQVLIIGKNKFGIYKGDVLPLGGKKGGPFVNPFI